MSLFTIYIGLHGNELTMQGPSKNVCVCVLEQVGVSGRVVYVGLCFAGQNLTNDFPPSHLQLQSEWSALST